MILLTRLKAGFEKRANCRCDCDAYRPNTLRGGGRIYLQKLTRTDFSFDLSPHIVIFTATHGRAANRFAHKDKPVPHVEQ